MKVTKLDHIVLTVRDIEETKVFYKAVLGMEPIVFGEERVALRFGNQKINLHEVGKEFDPKAQHPMPGSADLCFVTPVGIEEAMRHVQGCGVEVIEGPVSRTGANGSLLSFYLRDPSGNLIEVANEV
jgi:catechol 2,3-dioxygenase-like lactoylglutathione lyase family enzyme